MKFCCSLSFVHPDRMLEIARVAEEYGWDTLMLSDHVVNPDRIEAKYPYGEDGTRMWDHGTPWPDVWVATGAMAAVTQRIRFIQSVYVLPMRDPFHVAKALGTAALMSNYRVNLGLGLGWMHDEFAVLGHPFARRGARADEMVEVLRKLWTGEVVEHHGEFYDFEPLSMCPGMTGEIPIVVGGISEAALRRTARLADGWAPAYLSVEAVRQGVAKIRELQKDYGREDQPLSVYTTCLDAAWADVQRMEDAGVTHSVAIPWVDYEPGDRYDEMVRSRSLQEQLDGLKRFGDEIIARS